MRPSQAVRVAAALLISAFSLHLAAAVRGRYDVALLRTRFTDTTDALYTEAELTAAAGEMHDFFAQLSQGQLDLQVRVADVSIAGTWEHYHTCTDCSMISDAAEAAASAGMSFSDVEGILIVRAGCRENSGWTNGPATIARPGVSGTFQQSYDVECGRSSFPSTVNWGGWVHEIGHQLEGQEGRWDLTHPSGYSSGYNLMDSCYPCGEGSWSLADESLENETGTAAGKLVFPGWLPAARIAVVSPATSPGTTVVLSPVSDDSSTTTAAHGIKIPISTGRYYFLEARRHTRADGWQPIHDEGVQIMRVDESATPPGTMINSCDTLVAGGCNATGAPPCDVARPASTHPQCWPFALWKSGNTFSDPTNGIAIRVGPEVGNGFAVTVLRTDATGQPDLYVTPWLTPPMNTYETVDLWIDSSCNGYESSGAPLRYGRRPEGTVIGNGDDPCANHANRVFARVRNIGTSAASDARIRLDVTDPLGVGITGPAGWRTLGTATSADFPALASIPPGGEATVWVEWTPMIDVTGLPSRFDHHSCIRVAAAAVTGETIVTNLDGDGEQENIDHFEVSAGRRSSPAASHERSFRLMNDTKMTKTYSLIVDADLPKGWTYSVGDGSTELRLQPNESRQIAVKIVPSAEELKAGSAWHLRVGAYSLEPALVPPYVHMEHRELVLTRHGGVDFSAQAVNPTKIDAGVQVTGKTLAVTGSLDPAIDGAFVGIEYTMRQGEPVTHIVKTAGNGIFKDEGVPATNVKSVRAFWQGSATQASAETPDRVVGSSSTATAKKCCRLRRFFRLCPRR